MQTRALGNDRLEVSALGLGCMSMNALYGPKIQGERLPEAGLKMTGL